MNVSKSKQVQLKNAGVSPARTIGSIVGSFESLWPLGGVLGRKVDFWHALLSSPSHVPELEQK